MYITFDYYCSDCGVTDERFVRREEMDEQKCTRCELPVRKLPPGTRTTFRYADTKLKE